MANAPDLPRLTKAAYQTVTDQIALFENLPTVNDQQRAETRHREIMTQFGVINTRLDGMDGRFDQMQIRQTASEHNSLSRSLNSLINKAVGPIFALKTADNQDIPGFPATVEEALGLTGNQLDNLLRVLGQSTIGNVSDRKKRFFVHTGLAIYAT